MIGSVSFLKGCYETFDVILNDGLEGGKNICIVERMSSYV